MNAAVECVNAIGDGFIQFAWPMLIQSSVLIAILLLVNFLLRKRIRAVFRYWLWMLVLIKLILPVSLSTPASIGSLAGDKLSSVSLPVVSPRINATESQPPVTTSQAIPRQAQAETAVGENSLDTAIVEPASTAILSWQAVVFLIWLAIVAGMLALLVQRVIFVCGLIKQSKQPDSALVEMLGASRKHLGLKQKIRLKISPNATSPAVCGLFRPVILIPNDLSPTLDSSEMRAVLMHELAHIKRGDLWVNLFQTLLQIVYFYNPLLWLANAVIRRVREQAVDETVQVALGEEAPRYPETLLNVAKLAFERPALSLRLVGVVESKTALKERIKKMLNMPVPKTAKLGIVGLLVIAVTAVVLLPMAKATEDKKILATENTESTENLELRMQNSEDRSQKTEIVEQEAKQQIQAKSVFEQIDGQVIKFISEKYGQTVGEAEQKNLYTNDHVYYVDPNFVLYRGGINFYHNWTGRTITGKVRLTGTSYPNQTLYNASGNKLNTEIVPDKTRTNHWQVYWIPDEPLAPEETLYYGWSIDSTQKLLQIPGEVYSLKMQNQFGSHVIETFFLILPKGLKISQSNPPTASQELLNFDVYWWTQLMRQGENHLERVNIVKGKTLATEFTEGTEKKAKELVEDFFKHNYRDITARKTIEWGQPTEGENGDLSIRYKYEATIWGKDRIIENKIFTFDKNGKYLSAKSLSGFPQKTGKAAIDVAVEDFRIQSYAAGGLYTVTAAIRNNGSQAVPPFRLRFYRGEPGDNLNLHGQPQGGSNGAGPIEPNAIWNESSMPFELKDGLNEITVVIDYENEIAESDESNNQALLNVTVKDGAIVEKMRYIKGRVTKNGPAQPPIPYTQELVAEIRPDGTIDFVTTVRSINESDSAITTTNFVNSDFINVTSMSDGKSRPIEFATTHDGDIYSYHLVFNEPVKPKELMVYSHKGTMSGLVKPVKGLENTYRYYMHHWPGTGRQTRRIETFILPKGATLISTTPSGMGRNMQNGRIELHVDEMIPAGKSITTAFEYNLVTNKYHEKIELANDDGKDAGKWSFSGGGHGVKFAAPSDGCVLKQIKIYGSRYGEYQVPDEDFDVWVCDKNFNVIKNFKFPYSLFKKRGYAKWVTMKVDDVQVPKDFAICAAFDPHKTKGIYVHHDAKTSRRSYQGIPPEMKPFKDGDWMIRAIVEKPAGTGAISKEVSDADRMAAEDLVSLGWELWNQRKLAEAEKVFKEAVRKDSQNSNGWNGLGWAQKNQGKNANAKYSFEQCLDIEPNQGAALNGLGWIAKEQGETDKAIGYWGKAVEISHGQATASLSGLTQTYMELKRYDKAVEYYEMWLEVEPENEEVKAGLEKAKALR